MFIYVWAPPNNEVINFSFVILSNSLGLICLNIVEIKDFCDPHISGSIEFIVNSSLSVIPNVFSQLSGSQEVPQTPVQEISTERIQTSAQYHANKIQEEIYRMYEFLENKN